MYDTLKVEVQQGAEEDPPPPPLENTSDRSRPSPKYVGDYTRQTDGYTLQRVSDGLSLKAVARPPNKVTRAKSAHYLVDAHTGGYVSSLWGREFEHDGYRYSISDTGANRLSIQVKYRKEGKA